MVDLMVMVMAVAVVAAVVVEAAVAVVDLVAVIPSNEAGQSSPCICIQDLQGPHLVHDLV